MGEPVSADDNNDDVPWGTDPASPDDTALQTERTQPAAGDRLNPFLRAAPPVPAEAAGAAAGVAAKTPAPTVAARMSRPALLTGFAVLTAGVVLVVVNGLNSGTTAATAPAVWATAAPSSSPTSTSAAPVMVAPVVSISRMTATATVTITATATATTTTRITAAPAVTPTTPPRSQPPLGKTIPVPKAGPATTPPASGAPTRLSVLAGGSAVPGGVAVTASVDTDSAPVMVTVHVSGPQGSQQQFAVAPAAAGGGTYARTVHTGVGVVAVTVSATAGTRSASSAPFTVRVPS